MTTRRPLPLVAAVGEIAGAVGLELGQHRRGARPRSPPAPPRSTRLARAKDYAAADEIRAALQADGWIVETTAAGTTVRR